VHSFKLNCIWWVALRTWEGGMVWGHGVKSCLLVIGISKL